MKKVTRSYTISVAVDQFSVPILSFLSVALISGSHHTSHFVLFSLSASLLTEDQCTFMCSDTLICSPLSLSGTRIEDHESGSLNITHNYTVPSVHLLHAALF